MKKNLFILGIMTMGCVATFTACGDDDETVYINPDDAYDLDYSSDYGKQWANYMRMTSNMLKEDATTLYNDWTSSFNKGKSYGEQFKAHNGSLEGLGSANNCLSQIIDGCIDIAGEVGETKIGDPVNKWNAGNKTEALYAVESWYSWHSRDDYTNNIYSIRNAYYGNIYSKKLNNYDVVESNSISNLIKTYDAALDKKVKDAISAAAQAIQDIPQPFRNNIGSSEAKTAQEACGDLANLLEEDVKPIFENGLLSVSDATLDAVIAQYVDAVVIPTYKELVEKNTALDNAVKAFQKSPSNAAFEACANAWLAAREPWETSEAFLFGPVADKGLDPNMDSWPLDQVGIVNILNSQNFANLVWTGDYEELDEDNEDNSSEQAKKIAAAQNLRGFHTLEYLVFKDGKPRTIKN